MEIKDNAVIHRETLLKDLARFRDIEIGPQGEIYVLLEHNSGGQIIRLVPATQAVMPARNPAARAAQRTTTTSL